MKASEMTKEMLEIKLGIDKPRIQGMKLDEVLGGVLKRNKYESDYSYRERFCRIDEGVDNV